MTSRDELLRRVTIANPVPGDTNLPDVLSESRPPVALLIGDGILTDGQSKYQARRWWRGPAIAAAAALVVAVAVSIPLLIGGGRDEAPTADTAPTTLPTPLTTAPPPPVTTVPTTPAGIVESWGRVGADVMQPVVGLFAIAVANSRLVAAGFDPGDDFRQDGVIFASDDGTTWTRLAENDPALTTGSVLIYGITEGGPGLVAVGVSCDDNAFPCESGDRPTVWSSVNGTSWTRSVVDPDVGRGALQDVVKTDHGLVAAGWAHGPEADGVAQSHLTMWLSSDGLSWSREWTGDSVALGEDWLPGEVIGALASGSDGLIVGVGSARNEDGLRDAAVWISTDAHSWERIDPTSPAFASKNSVDVVMFDVTAGPAGLVAVGSEFGGASGPQVAVWHSSDARNWTRVDTAGQMFGTTGALSSVAALEAGFVAAGPEGFGLGEGPVTVWTSPDGSTWDRVLVLDAGSAQAMVTTGPAFAIAGQVVTDGGADAGDYHASVWMGPALDPNAPPPDPVPPVADQESPSERAGIGMLVHGSTCEELATEGYSYAEAVTYWMRYGTPVELDNDDDGLPCEDEYPASTIVGVYGGSDALPVRIVSDLPDAMAFVATGPAVDAGIVCPEGTIEFTDYVTTPIRDGSFTRWENRYTCDDGSGAFVLGADVFFDEPGGVNYGIWNIVSGTGSYE
ncbi:MAG: hypothetical protein MUQ27_04955, partial [Acidimicrobiia bacterium]|nr:hypothetical protein [Acidimicrobiia bacterium]